ncbi:MAG: 1-acyl-sn-glycerol-3-phosphate acyltransferase [Clostridia bacterium]|nr:1-acyl-sn-glycerol-3-phosphate acyltransferase [Clostridia bacterium]
MSDKKKTAEKIFILSVTVLVLALLIFFLKDIFFPFIKLEFRRDFEGAKELLAKKGALGFITVSLVEALQMVVIFIPAEFIQLSSGMSYPWYIAAILCDLGVILGASIIFLLVHVFKFDGDIFKRGKKIAKYERGDGERNIMILMYFLFFMPVIPFGAICYYASHKKLRYRKYILTCATGVIPSILTSNLMGTAFKQFIAHSLPVPLLILIIAAAAAILFALIFLILNKFYFKQSVGTPNYYISSVLTAVTKIVLLGRNKVKVTGEDVKAIREPYLVIANHASFFDYHFISQIDPERKFRYVVNRHIFNMKVVGTGAKKCGYIPKKIFDADVETIKKCLKTHENGYSVAIFPEGRLSNCGVLNYINPATAALAKKMGVPIVIARISGAYLAKPKWRAKIMRSKVTVEVSRIITAEELKAMDERSLYDLMIDGISYNDFLSPSQVYRSRRKAKGLDELLYLCPECRSLFSTAAKGNSLFCKACGKKYDIDKHYLFDDEKIRSIPDFYAAIERIEEENLDDLDLSVRVKTKIFRKDDNRYDEDTGVFRVTKSGVSYASDGAFSFEKTVDELEGIAYSAGSEFEMYNDNRLHYFYPAGEPKICTRIALIYDLLKRQENSDAGK